ncbi:mediator of DNA damage checkpoint protein 1-like [Ylistrum balloti]|uniref:mediator of DNA damage checkpoint protein 1-like n=1 Tax=Ylistrum balloti TaxID=509963 RepID=UPI002905CC5A|nr:mediator of DNA damage checkpoint protein 1-like [Ylistrum balloti]
MDFEQTQVLDFDGDFDDGDETDDEDAAKKPVAYLKVKSQKEFEEKVFEIYEGDNVIGRHEIACSVWIPLKALSREHACIEVKGDSHFIYDKGSRNKTRRGKVVLKPDVRYELTSKTSVTFGDVEAVYYIGEEINDKGSETGSEQFQTAPMEDEGIDTADKEGTTLLVTEEEEDYDSDASVDLLQPTQAYHSGRTLNLAPDSDEEEGPHHKTNVTVQDTPLPPKRPGAVGTTTMSTLVLPESDSDDEEEDRRKARAIQSLQTQVVADTQEEETEEEGEEISKVCPAMFGATQAYVMESESDDDATDDENAKNVSPAIFAAETQAFTDEGDVQKVADDQKPVKTFVADSEEDSNEENLKESMIDDETEGEDENIDVSHIFAASTLACDMADTEEEEENGEVKEAPQAFTDVADGDDDVATQMVNEDATQLVVATKVIEDRDEEATQVVEEEGKSENTATQCLQDATVAVVTDDPTVAVAEGATVAVTEDATVALPEEETMVIEETERFSLKKDDALSVTDSTTKVTENATVAVREDATMAVTEDATMAVTEDATMAVTEEATMAVTEEATVAVTEEATMAVTEEATMAVTEEATVAVTEEATMVVTEEEVTVAVTEDATMAITEEATVAVTDQATMAIPEEATLAFEATVGVTDDTTAVNQEGDTQGIDDATDVENDATQVIEDGIDDEEKSRGRPGSKSNTKKVIAEDVTQDMDDVTSGEDEATQVVEDINLPEHMPDGKKVRGSSRKRKGVKVTEIDTSNIVNDNAAEDEATQVIDDACVESEIQQKVSLKSKAAVGQRRKSKAKKAEEKVTQVIEDAEIGDDQATQVIEDMSDNTVKKSTEKVKGQRGRPRRRGMGKKATDEGAAQVAEGNLGETTEEPYVSGGEEATQVYSMEVDEEDLDQPQVSGQAKSASPRRGKDKVKKDLINLPALKPSEEETEAATQRYGGEVDEEDTPPLSEEVVQDSDEILGKSPIIPLPQTSPHKSALSNPEKRQKSPSPKRVKFAVESQSSESTNGDDDVKAESSTGNTATRSKLATAEVKVKKNVTKGRKSLPAISVEEKKEITSRKPRGRRSLPVSDLDHVALEKDEKKEVTEMEGVEGFGKKEPEVEVETTTVRKRGGRRSAGVKVIEEPKIEDTNTERKSTSSENVKQKEGSNVNGKRDARRGRSLTKDSEKVEDTILKTVDKSDKEVEQLPVENSSKGSKVETSVEEVKARGRGKRSVQAGGSGDPMEKDKTKLVRIGGRRKVEEAVETASTESTPDNPVHTEESPSVEEGEVKGRSSKGRKSKLATSEIKFTEEDKEECEPAEEVIEKGKKMSRGRQSKQLSEKEATEKEAAEDKIVLSGGRGKRSKSKLVEEEDSAVVEGEKIEKDIHTSKQESKKDKEVKDSSEEIVSRGGRRSKQVANNSDKVELVKEETSKTVDEVITEQEDKEEEKKGRRTGRGRILGRNSKLALEDKEEVIVKEMTEVNEPPKSRRGGRGKKVIDSSQDSVESEEISTTDLANMSGISERKPRGKQSVEVMSVDSKVESRTSRGKAKQKGDSVSVNSEEMEESESEVSTSRKTKPRGANKTKDIGVSDDKDSKDEPTDKESKVEQSKGRNKGRGKVSNLKEDVNITKCSEENDLSEGRRGRGRKTADTSVSVTHQEDPGGSCKGKTASRGKRGHSQDQDAVESPAKKTKDKVTPGTPVQSKTDVLSVDSPSLRRKSMDPKPRVMFTGMVDEQGQKTVKDLGGEMVTSVRDCTHLVTDKVRRTVKLLCCLSRGIPIVQPTWLSSSKQTGTFIQDVTPYLVKDTAAEKQYKFSLQRSIERASQASVLLDYRIHVTKSTRPDPSQMKDILECAGAQYLENMPSKSVERTVVVSCEEDHKLCQDALKANIPVVNAEFVLTGILQQEANPSNFQIFNNSKKRSAESSAEGPFKRRRR